MYPSESAGLSSRSTLSELVRPIPLLCRATGSAAHFTASCGPFWTRSTLPAALGWRCIESGP